MTKLFLALLSLLLAFPAQAWTEAEKCQAKDLDPNRVIIRTAVAKTYTEARGLALLGVEEKIPAAKLIINQQSISVNGDTRYGSSVSKLNAVWSNFILRSCKDKRVVPGIVDMESNPIMEEVIRVTVIITKKDVEYYPLPKGLTHAKIMKYDQGYGVYLAHFGKSANFSVNKYSGAKCITKNFCIFPHRKRLTPYVMFTIYHTFSGDQINGTFLWRNEVRGSIKAEFVMSTEDVDITELVLLELARREEGGVE